MVTEGRLWSREFVVLNLVLFLVSSTLAVFYQLHQYLETTSIDPRWFGLIIGADSLSSFLLLPLLSPFLHDGNARRWMFTGAVVMVVALLSYQAAATAPALVAVRILHGTGFMLVFAALMAVVVRYIPAARSGQAFGLLSMSRLVPYALIPPLVGGSDNSAGFFLACLDYGALVIGLVPVLLFLLGSSSRSMEKAAAPPGPLLRSAAENLKERNILLLLAINLLLFGGYTIVFFYLNQYGAHIGIPNTGYFFSIATAAMISVRLFGGAFFDRFGKAKLIASCMAVLAVCAIMLNHAAHAGIFDLTALLSGLGWGIAMPLLNALMFDVSLPRFRAMNINLSVVMMQGGFFLGPFAGGLVLAQTGYPGLFYLCAVGCLTAAGLAFMIRTKAASG